MAPEAYPLHVSISVTDIGDQKVGFSCYKDPNIENRCLADRGHENCIALNDLITVKVLCYRSPTDQWPCN